MFALPERITLWKRTGNDGFGGTAWSEPQVWPARISYSRSKATDQNGDEIESTAVCYTAAPLTREEIRAGVRVLLGAESSDAEPPADADDVRAWSQTPSGAGTLTKLWFA